MDLITLMQNARIKLKPFWPLSVGVCLVYGILIGGPPELNTYGELLSILLAGPLQLGLCIFFLKISNGFNPSFFDLFEGFKPLLNVLSSFCCNKCSYNSWVYSLDCSRYNNKSWIFYDLLYNG